MNRNRLQNSAFWVVLAAAVACPWGGCDAGEPPVPTTVAISPSSATLLSLGETVQLTADVRDQNGQAMTDIPVAWSGSERMPERIGGRPSVLWSPHTAAFGEDLHWWRSLR